MRVGFRRFEEMNGLLVRSTGWVDPSTASCSNRSPHPPARSFACLGLPLFLHQTRPSERLGPPCDPTFVLIPNNICLIDLFPLFGCRAEAFKRFQDGFPRYPRRYSMVMRFPSDGGVRSGGVTDPRGTEPSRQACGNNRLFGALLPSPL